MDVSIIIPTFNGTLKLPDTLNALRNQSYKDFQLVVVVDGSTDDTRQVLNIYRNEFPNYKIIERPNGGRSIARNFGVTEAEANILIFVDDDIELDPFNIEGHVRFIKENPSSILVGIPQLNYEKVKNDAFLKYRYQYEERAKSNQVQKDFVSVSFENYIFTTQNMSLMKSVFLSVGKFDERLTDSEDFDFSIRALQMGYKIYCGSGLKSFHNDFADLKSTIKRQRQYYSSKKLIMKFHPEYVELMPKQFLWNQPTWKDYLKELFFGKPGFWLKFFKTYFFLQLPSALRYQFYSIFIYTQGVLEIKRIK